MITTPALSVGQAFEITVDGWRSVFLRITAVANATSTTALGHLCPPRQAPTTATYRLIQT